MPVDTVNPLFRNDQAWKVDPKTGLSVALVRCHGAAVGRQVSSSARSGAAVRRSESDFMGRRKLPVAANPGDIIVAVDTANRWKASMTPWIPWNNIRSVIRSRSDLCGNRRIQATATLQPVRGGVRSRKNAAGGPSGQPVGMTGDYPEE